jgi:toxin-antitoxin system PIN domain toxin
VTYLLDVNVLIAALWASHTQHAKADAWMQGKQVAVCPITQIAFLRISSNPKVIAAPMAKAEQILNDFMRDASPVFVPDDLSGLGLNAPQSHTVTDYYLAKLAQHHKMKLATFDAGIMHPAVELIS